MAVNLMESEGKIKIGGREFGIELQRPLETRNRLVQAAHIVQRNAKGINAVAEIRPQSYELAEEHGGLRRFVLAQQEIAVGKEYVGIIGHFFQGGAILLIGLLRFVFELQILRLRHRSAGRRPDLITGENARGVEIWRRSRA